jgi:hypothetical protein
MKISKLLAIASSTLLFSVGLVAQSVSAATLSPDNGNPDPVVFSGPEFSFDSATNILSVDAATVWRNGATWVATSATDHFFACSLSVGGENLNAGFAANWAAVPDVPNFTSCSPLYSDSGATQPLTDGGNLANAYVRSGGTTYSYITTASDRPHIAIFTYAQKGSEYRVARSNSMQISLTIPTPSLTNQSSFVNGFAINGSAVSFVEAAWSQTGSAFTMLYACPESVDLYISPSQTRNPQLTHCDSINSAQQPMDPPADLTQARLYGQPWAPVGTVHLVMSGYISFLGTGYYVNTASIPYSADSSSSDDVVRSVPYTGPIVTVPQVTAASGGKVSIPGDNLSGVSKIEIGGLAATVTVKSDGELEITVPAGLAAGTYDLVVISDSGRLTVQGAIVVSGSAAAVSSGEARPSTKRMPDETAKVWVFDVAGAGKVQILVNGREIAWVRTADSSDPKLTNGYLVRTVELAEGKNVIEILVDGERVRRTVYSN